MSGRPPIQFPSRPVFLRRMAATTLFAGALIGGSLSVGVLGYHYLAALSWTDAFLNASMILGGMGPVDPLPTRAAKIFASFYALFSGVFLLATAAVLISPVVHRFLHRYHLGPESDRDE
ncbi:MAG TPA: hypothetical protein VGR38_01450 [Candidatus Polarisedimenticolia bacterium]|nr:hypothetical protein [Candidatus Polarisedimenticolia bacterium]